MLLICKRFAQSPHPPHQKKELQSAATALPAIIAPHSQPRLATIQFRTHVTCNRINFRGHCVNWNDNSNFNSSWVLPGHPHWRCPRHLGNSILRVQHLKLATKIAFSCASKVAKDNNNNSNCKNALKIKLKIECLYLAFRCTVASAKRGLTLLSKVLLINK